MTLGEIAKFTNSTIDSKFDNFKITNLGSLEQANSESIIYLALNNSVSKELDKSFEYKEKLKSISAGACFISENNKDLLPSKIIPVINSDPKLAFIKLTNKFYIDKSLIKKGIAKTASVASTVKFKNKSSVHIGEFAVIEDDVSIGENCYIANGVVIKTGVEIGDNCTIKDHAVISHSVIGNNVNIGEGSCIGGAGFGWHSSRAGHTWVPQLGRVVLKDNVDIGINTSIDRGTIGDTIIGEDTKIDNLVQIGHNVKIGSHCIFAGMSGVAGSTIIGDWTLVGAAAGISGHLHIGNNVQIAAGSGVSQSIPDNTKVGGYPALALHDYLKQSAMLRRMVKKKQ